MSAATNSRPAGKEPGIFVAAAFLKEIFSFEINNLRRKG
jgi:hypothetical protein